MSYYSYWLKFKMCHTFIRKFWRGKRLANLMHGAQFTNFSSPIFINNWRPTSRFAKIFHTICLSVMIHLSFPTYGNHWQQVYLPSMLRLYHLMAHMHSIMKHNLVIAINLQCTKCTHFSMILLQRVKPIKFVISPSLQVRAFCCWAVLF